MTSKTVPFAEPRREPLRMVPADGHFGSCERPNGSVRRTEKRYTNRRQNRFKPVLADGMVFFRQISSEFYHIMVPADEIGSVRRTKTTIPEPFTIAPLLFVRHRAVRAHRTGSARTVPPNHSTRQNTQHTMRSEHMTILEGTVCCSGNGGT